MPIPPLMISPYTQTFSDYLGRAITVSIDFDPSSRNLLGGFVTRDPDCLWTRIVWDIPTSGRAKRIPPVPTGTTEFTWQQIRNATTFRTIDDISAAAQITAEP